MPLETVTTIADLNPEWPLGTDEKRFGDDHIRNIKVALKGLVGGGGSGTGVEQLGFATIEQVLTAPMTQIVYAGTINRGAHVIAFLQQDAVGGRQVNWTLDKFDLTFVPIDINLDPNGWTICAFVGRSNGQLACYSVRMI